MNPLKYLLSIVPITVVLLSVSSGAKNPDNDFRNNLKAEYILLEGINQINQENYSDWFMMLQYASQLDTTDIDINAEFGEIILRSNGSLGNYEKAYQHVRRRFFNNPKDHISGLEFVEYAMKKGRIDDILKVYEVLTQQYPNRLDFAMRHADYLLYAYELGNESAVDSALAIVERLEQSQAFSLELAVRRLNIYQAKKDTASFINYVSKIYNNAPNEPSNVLDVARAYSLIELTDSVEYYNDLACKLDSTYGAAYMFRAGRYLADGDTIKFSHEVENVLRSPDLEFADKHHMLINYSSAFINDTIRRPEISRMFAIMEDQYPGEVDLHSLYAEYLQVCDSNATAAEQYSYSINLDPENPAFYRGKIENSAIAGDTVTAIATGRKASERFPDNFYFPFYTSALLHMNDSTQAALDLLNTFDIEAEDNTNFKSLFYQSRGDMLYSMELADSAFAEYELALEYEPYNAGALNNAAYYMSVANKNLDRAEQLIVRALDIEKDNPTYIDTYAWVLFKQKDYPAARRQIDIVLDLYGVDIDSISMDTTISTEHGEPSVEIYDHAGDIYFMNGEPQKALLFWEKALALDPKNEKIKKKVTHKTYFFE